MSLHASYTVEGTCYASGTALCPESRHHSLLRMLATQVHVMGKAREKQTVSTVCDFRKGGIFKSVYHRDTYTSVFTAAS